MPIHRARHLLLAAIALVAITLALNGCQSSNNKRPWAQITVNNSNGQQATIVCQQRDDCSELVEALDGRYQPIFLYPLRRQDRRDGRYQQYRLGQRVVPGKPELLPQLIISNQELSTAGPCLIIRWGPERLRVRGQVAGKTVSVNVRREDSCGEDQYLLWNIFAPTDQNLSQDTVLAAPPSYSGTANR